MNESKKTLLKFSSLEGLAKALVGIFQKIIGVIQNSPATGFLAYSIAETVKVASALYMRKTTNDHSTFVPSARFVRLAMSFGLVATIMCVGGIYTFQIGAELHTRTLIMTSSPVAAVFVQRIFFHDTKIEWGRQIPGMIIFVFAAWAMLGYPSSLSLAPWVWITLGLMVLASVNGVITKKASEEVGHNAHVWNFWNGITSVVLGFIGFLILGATVDITVSPALFVVFALLLGVPGMAISFFKFLAFKTNDAQATVDFQAFVMNMTYLVLAAVAVWILSALHIEGFDEAIELHHIVGIALFIPAYMFLDKKVFTNIMDRLM